MKSVNGIKSIENFRDLGGISALGGAIKRGMLYRSAQLGTATKEDVERFKQLGIAHIFDFRDEAERQKCPDFALCGAEYHFISASPEKASAVVELEHRTKEQIKRITKEEATAHSLLFAEVYGKAVFANPAFKAVFDALDEGKPILFHCVAGKDRTGAMAALLLLALGADKESVLRDYMLSAKYYEKKNAVSLFLAFLMTGNRYAVKELKAFLCPAPINVESIFSAIEKSYATYADFFLNEYGINCERLARWKKAYLE